ncbi:MAG: hypothetical protein KAQ75_03685 [Bacteroidales bacterium]|nr:hypothetical protein [Bacteroidales bacterium]
MKRLKLYFTTFIIISVSFALNAQTNEIINNKFTNSSQFLFNEFIEGDIYFKDGNTSSADLNYNVFFQEILFMKNEQSLALNMLNEISYIKFDSFEFTILNGKIYETIFNSNNCNVIKARKIDYGSASNTKGAYGASTETSATEDWKYLVQKASGVTMYPNVQSEDDKEFKLLTRYYIIKNDELLTLTKKKLFKLFPEKEEQLKNYIKDNKLSLSVDKDIIELFNILLK